MISKEMKTNAPFHLVSYQLRSQSRSEPPRGPASLSQPPPCRSKEEGCFLDKTYEQKRGTKNTPYQSREESECKIGLICPRDEPCSRLHPPLRAFATSKKKEG